MSLHLGLHLGMMMGIAKRFVKELPAVGKWLFCGIAAFIVMYGVYAFIQRDIGRYMLLKIILFFDFEKPLISFLADYIAVMVLFALVSHYFFEGLR